MLPRRTNGIQHAGHWIVSDHRVAVKALDRHCRESDGLESIAKGRQCIFVRGRDLYCELLNFLPVLLFNPLQGFDLGAFDIDFQQVDALQNSAVGSGRSTCTLRKAM